MMRNEEKKSARANKSTTEKPKTKKRNNYLTNTPSKESLIHRLTSDTFSTRTKKKKEEEHKKPKKAGKKTARIFNRTRESICEIAKKELDISAESKTKGFHKPKQSGIKKNSRKNLLSNTISGYSAAAKARLGEKKVSENRRKISQMNIRPSSKLETNSSSKNLYTKKGKSGGKGFQTERKSQPKLYSQQKSGKKLKKKVVDVNKSQTPKFAGGKKAEGLFPSPKPKAKKKDESNTESPSLGSGGKASPDFKINLSNQSRAEPKESNKSLKIESVEGEEKFSEIVDKDSNFIDIVDNEINAHDSFSQNPIILTTPKDYKEEELSSTQIQLEEKTKENQRILNQNFYLQQEVGKYEEMLSKMNQEYEKLLNDTVFKNNANDEEILTLKQELNNLKISSDQKINSLDSQLKESQRELQVKNEVIETSKKTISDLEAELTTSMNQSLNVNKNEFGLRAKIDELNAKVIKYEGMLREHKETEYVTNTENANLKSDIQNLTNVERALRNEIRTLMEQRQELENTLQIVKNKISQDSLQLRKYDSETESLNRQLMSMENTINIANKEVEDLNRENKMLKESLNNKERENILLKKTVERKEGDLQNANTSLNRANSLLEAHQNNTEYYDTSVNNRNTEYSAPRERGSHTPDHLGMNRKAVSTNAISSFLSPYDSPIASFRRQNQPTQSPYVSQSAQKEPIMHADFSKSLPPMRSSTDDKPSILNLSESVSGIDNGSMDFVQSQLKSMTSEKKRLEQEYNRLPIVIQKSPAIKRRKEFLENQLNLLEKNIDIYTIRLRELNS